ncbi:c-type cytochrome [Citreimonas sp.]|uniref:c-type cytochrome n=1 Tax=Citreimonas sp. TaxID=3036715 RepID=UPI00405A259F
MKALPVFLGAGIIAGAALLWVSVVPTGGDAAPDAQVLAQGQAIYVAQCAACHGADLEGQPDWRTRLPSGRLPAPPHDASGHTWHHSDDVLFRIVHDGTAAVVGNGYESDMPGFGEILEDEDIRAVLAYIKSTWPERERAHQEEVSRQD